jgi:hypothetical protein
VASWYEVQWRCGLGFLLFGGVLGCADPGTRTVWAINNPAILWHECNHIKALEGGKSELSEWVADISYGWLLGNMAMAFTLPLGAGENPCGESYKGAARGRWVRLPTLEEVANGAEVPFAKQNRITEEVK